MILIADIEFFLMLAKEGLFNNIIICGRDDDKNFKEMDTNETHSGKRKNEEIRNNNYVIGYGEFQK